MPTLTRRRSHNPHQVTWHIYYGDVHVGTIGERAGVPVDVDQCLTDRFRRVRPNSQHRQSKQCR
jgi:hypothetical protein